MQRSSWERVVRGAGRVRVGARDLVRRHLTERATAQEERTDDQNYRRHQLRQLGVLVTLPGILIGTGSIAAAWGSGLMSKAPTPTCEPLVVPAPARGSFEVRVLNTSGQAGAATSVAKDLGKRGFRVIEASTAPDDLYVRAPAKIFHGPKGLDQALLAAQQIPGAELSDDGRPGTSISFVLGADYTALAPLPPVDPPVPSKIKVNVYNTTWREGLASLTGKELAQRGFGIGATGNDPDASFLPDAVAVVRYGPDGAQAAKVLSAQVRGVTMKQIAAREGTDVDLVLGNRWTQLIAASALPPAPTPKPVPKATVTRPCTPKAR